jgi:hypothetical protein
MLRMCVREASHTWRHYPDTLGHYHRQLLVQLVVAEQAHHHEHAPLPPAHQHVSSCIPDPLRLDHATADPVRRDGRHRIAASRRPNQASPLAHRPCGTANPAALPRSNCYRTLVGNRWNSHAATAWILAARPATMPCLAQCRTRTPAVGVTAGRRPQPSTRPAYGAFIGALLYGAMKVHLALKGQVGIAGFPNRPRHEQDHGGGSQQRAPEQYAQTA